MIRPLLGQPGVEFVGEIGEAQKAEFLGGAAALLFPIDWPEPFGMVMIEAMACGTPVVAFGRGSVPEVVEDGVSGFVVEDGAAAVAALESLPLLCRARVRKAFEARFTCGRMAGDYLELYGGLVGEGAVDAGENIPPLATAAGAKPAVTAGFDVVALRPTVT